MKAKEWRRYADMMYDDMNNLEARIRDTICRLQDYTDSQENMLRNMRLILIGLLLLQVVLGAIILWVR